MANPERVQSPVPFAPPATTIQVMKSTPGPIEGSESMQQNKENLGFSKVPKPMKEEERPQPFHTAVPDPPSSAKQSQDQRHCTRLQMADGGKAGHAIRGSTEKSSRGGAEIREETGYRGTASPRETEASGPLQAPGQPRPQSTPSEETTTRQNSTAPAPTSTAEAAKVSTQDPTFKDSGLAKKKADGSPGQQFIEEDDQFSPSREWHPGSSSDSDIELDTLQSDTSDDDEEFGRRSRPAKVKTGRIRRLRHSWTAEDIDVVLAVVEEELARDPHRLTVARWESIRSRWAELRGFKPGKVPMLAQLRMRLGGLAASGDLRFKLLKEEAAARRDGRPFDVEARLSGSLAKDASPSKASIVSKDGSAAPSGSIPSGSPAPRTTNLLLHPWTDKEERLLLDLFADPETLNQPSLSASAAYVHSHWVDHVDGVHVFTRTPSALGERLRNIARREGSGLDQQAFEIWQQLPCGTSKGPAQHTPRAPRPSSETKVDPTSSQTRKRPAPLQPSTSQSQPAKSDGPAPKKQVRARLTNNSLASTALEDIFGSTAREQALELEMQDQRGQIDELSSELRKMQDWVKQTETSLAAQMAEQAASRTPRETDAAEELSSRFDALDASQAQLRWDSIKAWESMQEARKEQKLEMEELAKKVLEPLSMLLKSQVEIKNRLDTLEQRLDKTVEVKNVEIESASPSATAEQQRNGDALREQEREHSFRLRARQEQLEWDALRRRHDQREREAAKVSETAYLEHISPTPAYYPDEDMDLDHPQRAQECHVVEHEEMPHGTRASGAYYETPPQASLHHYKEKNISLEPSVPPAFAPRASATWGRPGSSSSIASIPPPRESPRATSPVSRSHVYQDSPPATIRPRPTAERQPSQVAARSEVDRTRDLGEVEEERYTRRYAQTHPLTNYTVPSGSSPGNGHVTSPASGTGRGRAGPPPPLPTFAKRYNGW